MSTRTVYIHKNTTNISFLAMYKILSDLGVKNNRFFLRTYDKELLNVDPFKKNLSPEIKARILREVKINPWYFIREIIRIPVAGNQNGVKFQLHRGNLALLWCLFNNINSILILPRQNFKTISACCFYAYEFDFGTESSEFLFMYKEFSDAKQNVKRLKDIRQLYPEWMKIDHKDDKNNIEEIYKFSNKNRVKAISSALDADKADKLGRGMTSPNHWYDEFAFLKFNKIIHGAASPAFSQAAYSARENGKCFSKLITTTPSNLDIPQGRFCMDLIEDSARFIEELYDMTKDEVRDYIRDNSSNDYVYIFYSYKQLGRSEEWFRDQCRNLANDITLIKREVLCEWSYSADKSPFSEDELQEVENFKKESIQTILFKKRFGMEVYEELDGDREYIVSVDVSGGLNRDFSVVVMSDPYDLRTVAVFSNNKIDTPDLEDFIRFIHEEFPNAFFIIERNSYGLGIIQHLQKDYSLNKKLFYSEVIDKETKKKTITVGIDTTPKTRPKILEAFSILVTEEPYTLVSPIILKDTKSLEVKKNGKIEHIDGGHDDAVMAKAFAKYCMIHHYNTMKRFLNGADLGIDKKGRKLLNVSQFNRKGYFEKTGYTGTMNIGKSGEAPEVFDGATHSKLYSVTQLNHLDKMDGVEIYSNTDKPREINPEAYFDRAQKGKPKKRRLLIL